MRSFAVQLGSHIGREKSPRTDIKIGATDGFRYLACKPPLTDAEKTLLEERGLLRGVMYSEEIPGKDACTQLQTINEFFPPARVVERGKEVADALRDMRRGVVVFDATPVSLNGAGSTPFNPITK